VLHWVARCVCHEHVVEDVYHTAVASMGLDSGVGPSSAARTSSGVGHDNESELSLDTMVDILSQLEDALDPTQPLHGG
jgi:hypothetical protein